MLRKQFTVGRINDATQKNLNSVIAEVRTEVHNLNGSAAFDRDTFRGFSSLNLRVADNPTRDLTTLLKREDWLKHRPG